MTDRPGILGLIATMPRGARAKSTLVACGLVVAVIGGIIQLVVLRSLFDLGRDLSLGAQRIVAWSAFATIAAAVILIDVALAAITADLGRRLERRARAAIYAQIDSAGGSSIAISRARAQERASSLAAARRIPAGLADLLRSTLDATFSIAALLWLAPASAIAIATTAVVCLLTPSILRISMKASDAAARASATTTQGFMVETLRALVAVRAQRADAAVATEYGALSSQWADAARAQQDRDGALQSLATIATLAPAIWVIAGDAIAAQGESGAHLLLLALFATKLASLGRKVVGAGPRIAGQLPMLAELSAPIAAATGSPAAAAPHAAAAPDAGARLTFRDVTLEDDGHPIVVDVNLEIAPGEHIGIVGPSGSGKSALLELVLGYRAATLGRLLIDGGEPSPEQQRKLRARTAWVTPGVDLFDRSLADNLLMGETSEVAVPLARVIEEAGLGGILDRLPAGLKTPLGEGGAMVSSGEAQQIRFARALLRRAARLVVLDEPFRGLEHPRRSELFARARRWWRGSTMLMVTRDVRDTLDLDRVIVMDGGRVVEAGAPRALAAQAGSRYAGMLAAEQAAHAMWSSRSWRTLVLEDGHVVERDVPQVREAPRGRPNLRLVSASEPAPARTRRGAAAGGGR